MKDEGTGQRDGRVWASSHPFLRAVSSWARAIVFSAVVVACLLGVIEILLRLAGYGHSTEVFTRRTFDGQAFYAPNAGFYETFYGMPSSLLVNRDEFEVLIPSPKPPHTYRVFVFGGSVAWGEPDSAYSFWRMLRVMLQARFPGTDFEVHCVAFPYMNSHVMRVAAQQCAKLEPDLYIVYMGGNEVLGPYAGWRHLTAIRANILLSRSRVFQAINSKFSGSSATFLATLAGPMPEMQQDLPAFDARRGYAWENFATNLTDICQAGTRAGAQVLLCTEGFDAFLWSPPQSQHRPDIATPDLARWETAYQTGRQYELAGSWADAVRCYEEAGVIDGQYAELHYARGRCFWQLEQYDAAERAFARARALSLFAAVPGRGFYAPTLAVASAQAGEGTALVDTARALVEHTPPGARRCGFFRDVSHLTLDGYYLAARALYEAVISRVPEAVRQSAADSSPLSRTECRRRLALNARTEERLTRLMLGNLTQNYESYLADAVEYLERRAETLRQQAAAEPELARTYAEVARQNPTDYLLNYRYAVFLVRGCDFARALEHCSAMRERFPYQRATHRLIGAALAGLGQTDAAAAEFEQQVRVYPDDAKAYAQLGSLLQQEGRPDAALAAYDKALALDSYAALDAPLGKAEIFEQRGDFEAAGLAICRYVARFPLLEEMSFTTAGARYYEVLNRLYTTGQDVQGRVAKWAEFARQHANVAPAHFYLAQAYEAAGNTTAAAAEYQRAAALCREHGNSEPERQTELNILIAVADEIRETGDLLGAVAAYREAAPLPRLRVGPIQDWPQECKMARDDCRKAQELSLRSPVQQAALGNSLVKYGDYAAAVEPFRAALQLDPGMGEVRLRLIDALLESQQRDAARQEADECRRRNVTVPAGRLDKLDPHEGKPPAGP